MLDAHKQDLQGFSVNKSSTFAFAAFVFPAEGDAIACKLSFKPYASYVWFLPNCIIQCSNGFWALTLTFKLTK